MTTEQLRSIEANPNATTLVMGGGGSGKSSLLATAAEYVYETTKKWSSYYLCDGGGVPTQVSALQRLGIVKLFRMRTRSAANSVLETIHRSSQGWWPERIKAVTGEVEPNVRMIAPVTTVIGVTCPCGAEQMKVRHQNQIPQQMVCIGCGKPLNAANWQLKPSMTITPGFEDRGACLYDGVTSAGEWSMHDISFLDLGGEKSRLGGRITSGEMIFGENNRAQVGFAQTRSLQWLENGASIPNLVIPAIWTCLPADGRDEGMAIVGPKLPGVAKTTIAPQSVGNLLECDKVKVGKDEFRRLYIKSYVDENGARHLLKPRAYPGLMPAYLEDPDTDDPQQARFVNFNLGTFFKLMDNARLQDEARVAAKHPELTPIADVVETFGSGMDVIPQAPVAPAGRAVGGPRAVPAARGRVATPKAVAPAVVTPVAAPVAPAPSAPITAAEVDAVVASLDPAPIVTTPAKPIPVPAVVAQPTAPAPAQAQPPAPRPPARGPVAAPPGRRPQPVGVVPRPKV